MTYEISTGKLQLVWVGATHTKEFTEEKERPVFFVVDQSILHVFWNQGFLKSVIAAQLAAGRLLEDFGSWRSGWGVWFLTICQIDYIKPKRDRKGTVSSFCLSLPKKTRN